MLVYLYKYIYLLFSITNSTKLFDGFPSHTVIFKMISVIQRRFIAPKGVVVINPDP